MSMKDTELTISKRCRSFVPGMQYGPMHYKTRISYDITNVRLTEYKGTFDIAPLCDEHHPRSAQVWHVFSRDLTVLPAHPHVHQQSE